MVGILPVLAGKICMANHALRRSFGAKQAGGQGANRCGVVVI